MAFTIRVSGPSGDIRKVSRVLENFQIRTVNRYLKQVADWSVNRFQYHIESNRKRDVVGSPNLSKLFKVHVTSSGYGVGDIESLNIHAPYWQVLNSGKTRGGKKFLPGGGKAVPSGSFVGGSGNPAPTPGASGGAWVTSSSGPSFTFVAKKFIQGTKYIDTTLDEVVFKLEPGLNALMVYLDNRILQALK